MKDKSETYTIKLNPIKEDISKQRKDKENKVLQKKKTEHKLIKDSLSMFPFKGFNFIRSEIRNTTAPNKNRPMYKKNFQHLKITAKNKEIIDKRFHNYNDILMSKKILGKSLPKNSLKNNTLFYFTYLLIFIYNFLQNYDIMN